MQERSTTYTWDGLTLAGQTDSIHGATSYLPDAFGRTTGQTATPANPNGSWLLADNLNSTLAMATPTGTISQVADWGTFGTFDAHTAGWDAAIGYTSQATNPATGTVAFYARNYDPTTASFTTTDSWEGLLDLPETLNNYAYVLGNPLSSVDVLGYWPSWVNSATKWVGDHKKEILGAAAGLVVAAGVIALGVATGGVGLVALGAIAGGAGGAASYAVTGHGNYSWQGALGAVAGGAIGGAAGGALFGGLGGGFLGSVAAGAASGGSSSAVNYAISNIGGEYSWKAFGTAVVTGTVFGAALGGLGWGVTGGLKSLGQQISASHKTPTTPKIGANGLRGEAFQRYLSGGRKESFDTDLGWRYVDSRVASVTRPAMRQEVKVGRTSLTALVRSQIAKDRLIMATEPGSRVQWHFWRSDVTGKVGPTLPLENALKSAGIQIVIHNRTVANVPGQYSPSIYTPSSRKTVSGPYAKGSMRAI